MRPWLLLAVLACRGGGDPVVDTDDTDDGDVVGSVDTDDTDPSDTAAEACLLPLDRPQMPTAWDGVVARAEVACLATSTCDEDGELRVRVWQSECEGSRVGFYDATGTLLAEHMWDDTTGWCGDDARSDVWYGRVVRGCESELQVGGESAACAVPTSLPTPAAGCVVDGPPVAQVADLTGWADLAAYARVHCVGLATCTLGERTVDLAYRDGPCGDGSVDARDHATGALVASLDPSGWSEACSTAPHWVGEDLSACLPVTFTPSEGCGIVTLP